MITVELLHSTFEDSLPKLTGVYVGRLKTEMESMFHFAYWLYYERKMTDSEIHDTVFKMAPFTIGEVTKIDLSTLINKAKELC